MVTNPNMQKAIFVDEIGKPMVLRLHPVPAPPAGYVQIKILATMRKSLRAQLLQKDHSLTSVQIYHMTRMVVIQGFSSSTSCLSS
jgi:hypothetical protein